MLRRSTTYHPQSDGQTEVVNCCLETYPRCFSSKKPKEWSKWIHWAEYWYNTSFHSALGSTPFKALYGKDPPPLVRYKVGQSMVSAVDQLLADREEVFDKLQMNLLQAQQKNEVVCKFEEVYGRV